MNLAPLLWFLVFTYAPTGGGGGEHPRKGKSKNNNNNKNKNRVGGTYLVK